MTEKPFYILVKYYLKNIGLIKATDYDGAYKGLEKVIKDACALSGAKNFHFYESDLSSLLEKGVIQVKVEYESPENHTRLLLSKLDVVDMCHEASGTFKVNQSSDDSVKLKFIVDENTTAVGLLSGLQSLQAMKRERMRRGNK